MTTSSCHRRCGGAVQPDRGSSRPPSRGKLRDLAAGFYPPSAEKTLRRFPAGEAARLLGITEVRLRQLPFDRLTPDLEIGPAGRRYFTLAEIHTSGATSTRSTGWGGAISPTAIPIRTSTSRSSRSRTSRRLGQDNAHGGLAHFLTLHGYRVLAIDADPQASLSTCWGCARTTTGRRSMTRYGTATASVRCAR